MRTIKSTVVSLIFASTLWGLNQARAQDTSSILELLPGILAGATSLPKPIDFTVRQPLIPPGEQYVIDVDQWDIPNNRSQPVKTTNQLQAAIDYAKDAGFNHIAIPAGHYLIGKYGNAIYQRGIELQGSTELVLQPGAILEMATNNKWNYCVIAVTGQSDVWIRGGTIKGDRATHIYTPRAGDGKTAHDEGHGICLQNGTNRVRVENMTLRDLTGDGALLVTNVSDITFSENQIFNNRRQGISIVGGTRIEISHNEIHHIRGTSPQFGIDIEGAGRIDRDIVIRNNYFHHNRGGDIVNTSGRNVFIVRNRFEQGEGSQYVDGPIVSWHRTDQVIARNAITMTSRSVNGMLGYIQYSGGGPKGHNRVTYVHDNVCHGCGMYMYRSADADIRNNQFLGYFLSLSDFRNATVIGNEVTSSLYCWSYRIRNTTGLAKANRYNGLPVTLPLSSRPWTTPCLRR